MSALAEAQGLFWRAARSEVASEALEACFVGDGRLGTAARLGIYRSAYYVRQVNALRELFPRVAGKLGDGLFARTASRYVGAEPSTACAVEGIALGFPAWLRREHGELLGDWAVLELASFEVFVAPDEAPLPLAAARSPSFAETPLRVGAQVRLVEVSQALLAELQGEAQEPLAAPEAARAERGALVVWRAGHRIYRLPVTPREGRALAAAKAGVSLETLCGLLGGEGTEPALVRDVLIAWFARGWLVESVSASVPSSGAQSGSSPSAGGEP